MMRWKEGIMVVGVSRLLRSNKPQAFLPSGAESADGLSLACRLRETYEDTMGLFIGDSPSALQITTVFLASLRNKL